MTHRRSVCSGYSAMAAAAVAFAMMATSGSAFADEKTHIASQSAEKAPTLTVEWLPPCSERKSEPYFAIDVFADGTVRYVGGPRAKEIGERTGHLSRKDTQRVLKHARQFISSDTSPVGSQSEKPSLGRPYCLNVSMQDGRAKRSSSELPHSQPLIQTVDELVGVKKWVCPGRTVPRTDLFLPSTYCVDDRIAGFGWILDRCHRDSVEIHSGGTLVHRLEHTQSGSITEQFYQLSEKQLHSLFLRVSKFKLERDTTVSGGVSHSAQNELYRTTDIQDLSLVRKQIGEWVRLQYDLSSADSCGSADAAAALWVKASVLSNIN
jgi:hypothetical protein